MKEINQIYNDFTTKLYNYSFQVFLSKKIITSQKEQILNTYSQYVSSNNYDEFISLHAESFYSWKNREIIKYGQKNISINDLVAETVYYHNKVYQWLLAISFEAYEEYLIKTSRILFKNKNYKSAKKILNVIRIHFPDYQSIENENNKFLLSLIENFRHKIVHCNGIVDDRPLFLKKTLEEIGLFNNGNYNLNSTNILNSFFMPEFGNEIVLLEIPVLELSYIRAETTVLNNLLSVLLNSAYFINSEILKQESAN